MMLTFKKLPKTSQTFLGFLQAFGIFLYCSLVGFLIWVSTELFGSVHTYLGPMLFLALLVASVLICALLAFGYPVLLYLEHKDSQNAIKIVGYTAAWLFFFVILVIVTLAGV